MTVTTTATRTSTAGDGAVTVFSFPYLFFSNNDLQVTLVVDSTGVETVQTITTHYTVVGAGVAAGGTVTMGTAPASGETLLISRVEQFTQGLDLVENDPFPSALVEQQLDTLTMLAQQTDTQVGRSLRFVEGYTGSVDPRMPAPVAGAFLAWNSAGTAVTTSTDTAAQWLGGNGTASLPYYSFTSDPNSGFYRIGADNIGLTLGGTKRVDFAAATTAFTGEVTATGFTGTLDGTLGGGTPAAATVTSLTSGGVVVSDTDSTDDLGTTGVRWRKLWVDDIQTTADAAIAGDLTVTGDLTINGTTVTNDATNTVIKDPLIELNTGAGSNANDLGLVMERGSTGNNAFMGWDESADKFAFGTTTATGASTGNISYADAQVLAEGATFSGTSPNLGTVTTVDINGGTVDGAVIGGASAAAITGTTITASTSLALASGATITGFADEDTMSSDSATLGVTQQSAKAYVDSSVKAPGVQMLWETTTTDTDQGAGKVWANNATLASATVLYFDDVEKGGVSINALVDSLDDPTADNSATIYIQEAGNGTAGVLFKVSGAVTSASTYSKVAVTHVATFGTLVDGDTIGVIFAFSGDAPTGDVVGPGSATDNTVARYNSTTGKLIQGSGVTIDDSNNVGAASLTLTTDLAVAHGGTGASTFTDGGVLLGSGTGAVTAMAVLTDGQMIVGDGTTDPVAESGATLRTSIGVGTGDNLQVTNLTATGAFTSLGIDDNASTTAITISADEQITLPLQPGFMGRSNPLSNIPGDGTAYTILYPTERFDVGANYSSPDYTAPITGKYIITLSIEVRGLASDHTDLICNIVTSNRTYNVTRLNPSAIAVSGIMNFSGSMYCDMDAADTATTTLKVSGGSKVVDIDEAYWSVALIG